MQLFDIMMIIMIITHAINPILQCATTNGTAWIVMGSTQNNLLSIVSVNLTSGAVKKTQVLTCGAVVGALHMFEVRGRVYLVLGANGMVNDVPAESRFVGVCFIAKVIGVLNISLVTCIHVPRADPSPRKRLYTPGTRMNVISVWLYE